MEDDSVIGVLDTNPTVEGHCLVIPKMHVRSWYDLRDDEIASVFGAAKTVAKQIRRELKPDFVCVFIRGGRMKHTHVVLFPSYENDKLSGFPQSVLGKAEVDFKELQARLQVSERKEGKG